MAITHLTQVIMLRHAQSQWNQENLFTGWADPPLTQKGVIEAIEAGRLLKRAGFRFCVAYSSYLKRAKQTLDIVLEITEQEHIPVEIDWRLNERHYGALQGKSKTALASELGEEYVHRIRRGYIERAEPIARDDPLHPIFDPLYQEVSPHNLPSVESLADTRLRVTHFWREKIISHIKRQECVLISSHGNTLRALIMELSSMSIDDVEKFEIPTGKPIIYHFDATANPVNWEYL